MAKIFSESCNKPLLFKYLSKIILDQSSIVEGKWFFDDLNLRLACHGRKHYYQFINDEKLFFDWINKAEHCIDCDPTEDYFFGNSPIKDLKINGFNGFSIYIKNFINYIIFNLITKKTD